MCTVSEEGVGCGRAEGSMIPWEPGSWPGPAWGCPQVLWQRKLSYASLRPCLLTWAMSTPRQGCVPHLEAQGGQVGGLTPRPEVLKPGSSRRWSVTFLMEPPAQSLHGPIRSPSPVCPACPFPCHPATSLSLGRVHRGFGHGTCLGPVLSWGGSQGHGGGVCSHSPHGQGGGAAGPWPALTPCPSAPCWLHACWENSLFILRLP